MPALYMQYDCHRFVPAAMIQVAAALLVTVWIVCSDPHPFASWVCIGCCHRSGQKSCSAVKGGCLVGVSELIFLALKAGTIDVSSGVAECDRFWVATLVLEAESLIDI